MTERDLIDPKPELPDDTPISWKAIPPKTPVLSSDGQSAGTVIEVLGSRDEDIFHGLIVHEDDTDPVHVVRSLLDPDVYRAIEEKVLAQDRRFLA